MGARLAMEAGLLYARKRIRGLYRVAEQDFCIQCWGSLRLMFFKAGACRVCFVYAGLTYNHKFFVDTTVCLRYGWPCRANRVVS